MSTIVYCTNVPECGIFVPMSLFAARLAERRDQLRLSRPKLADQVGLSEKTIINYEAGNRDPKLADAMKLAEALNTSLAYLAGEIDDPSVEALKNATESVVVEPITPKREVRWRNAEGIPGDVQQKYAERLLQLREERDRLRRIQEIEEEEKRIRREMGEE